MLIHKNILIIADIEGSSSCVDYESTRFLGKGWPRACLGMTRDVNAVATALLAAGARTVCIKDFHRTGYNLFRAGIDPGARLISGYRAGPVPGIGKVDGLTGVILTGMHAPSGTRGFLAHTLTSRISLIEVNGRPLGEAELFCSSLAPFGLRPLLFSGCPAACDQAGSALGLPVCPITPADKQTVRARRRWREKLAQRAVLAAGRNGIQPHLPKGPFNARIHLKAGPGKMKQAARAWGHAFRDGAIHIRASDMNALYRNLIALAYFTPWTFKLAGPGLTAYRLAGAAALFLARTGLVLSGRNIRPQRF